jgi:hypothetical protein
VGGKQVSGYSIGERGNKLRPVKGGPFRKKSDAGVRAIAFNDAIQIIKDTANTDMLIPQGRGKYNTPYPDITVQIYPRTRVLPHHVYVRAFVHNECVPPQNISIAADFPSTASCKEWADMMVRMLAIQINHSKYFMQPYATDKPEVTNA